MAIEDAETQSSKPKFQVKRFKVIFINILLLFLINFWHYSFREGSELQSWLILAYIHRKYRKIIECGNVT